MLLLPTIVHRNRLGERRMTLLSHILRSFKHGYGLPTDVDHKPPWYVRLWNKIAPH